MASKKGTKKLKKAKSLQHTKPLTRKAGGSGGSSGGIFLNN
jgi:hypothetical protein